MRGVVVALLVATTVVACAPDDDPTPAAGGSPSADASPSAEPSPLPTVEAGPLRVAVIGDLGSGLPAQQEVADRMCEIRAKRPFDHVFTTGDNIYPDGSPELFEERFFEPYDCLFADGVKWHAALGNHDVIIENGAGELGEPAFGIESRNYVVRLGDIRFVIADSNDLKMRFLRRKTRASSSGLATVVLFHHPVFSAGDSHGPTPGLAGKVIELFSERGVDLVLHGHDHVYSKSKPVGGVRYVVTGGGGAKLNGCRPSTAIVKCESRHHFLQLSFGSGAVTVQAIPVQGKAFDVFQVPYRD